MKRIVLLVPVVLALAGCASAHSASAASARSSSSAPAPSSTMNAITCTGIDPDLQTVLTDLKTEDAKEQEAWVTGGDSGDLQALISDTQDAGGGGQLAQDAATFAQDASGYLSDQSPYLAPGWTAEYHQVRADINALAGDCGLSQVPASPGAS